MRDLHQVLNEISLAEEVRQNIGDKLCLLLKAGGVSIEEAEKITQKIFKCIKLSASVADIEDGIREILNHALADKKLFENILLTFGDRTGTMFNQIKMWIDGDSVLDFGGGNGRIGKKIKDTLGKSVMLSDTRNYNNTNLPFILFDGKTLPVKDNTFSTVLLLTVLHHTKDPDILIREARRLGRRLIIIETVYGGKTEEERQADFISTAFFDWLTNRVLLRFDIDVPCSYKSVPEWTELFTVRGFTIKHSENLAQDHGTIFLNHHLFVLDS